jgi:hypothetical protein
MSFKKIPFWVKQRKPLPGKLDKSRKVVVEKFTQQRTAARKANHAPPDLDRIRAAMQSAERAAMNAGVPRPNFPFSPQDVAAIHTRQHGEDGIWFRLESGRVFSSTGEPDSPAPDAYSD